MIDQNKHIIVSVGILVCVAVGVYYYKKVDKKK